MSLGMPLAENTVYAQKVEKYSAPRVGDQAPDFLLDDFNGKKFALSKLIKKGSVVLWFTNLCEGCQSEIPTVFGLKAEYEKKGVEVVAVSVLGKDRKTRFHFVSCMTPLAQQHSATAGSTLKGHAH